ncbi:hypothetical protein ACRJ4W_41905 [Streptomyces sp. GLT-R25]
MLDAIAAGHVANQTYSVGVVQLYAPEPTTPPQAWGTAASYATH